MRKRSKISVVFFVLLTLSILIFIISLTGILSGPSSIFAKILSPFQSISFSGFNFLSNSGGATIQAISKTVLSVIANQWFYAIAYFILVFVSFTNRISDFIRFSLDNR